MLSIDENEAIVKGKIQQMICFQAQKSIAIEKFSEKY
jgi:hypothetical protein